MLERQLGQSLVCVEQECIDPIYGWDTEVVEYRLAQPVSIETLEQARELVRATLVPTTGEEIIKELARLRVLMASRAGEETDREAGYLAIAEELAEFPPDVIRSALRKIARRETFFPSLAEMLDQCQREARNRRLIAYAVGFED